MSSSTALKTFSLTNEILEVSPQDEIYRFDVEANKKINRDALWTKESANLLFTPAPSLMQLLQPPLLQIMQDFCRGTDQDGTSSVTRRVTSMTMNDTGDTCSLWCTP